MDFCHNWVKDLDSHPEAVGRFLSERVRAFFSTCVGLASWRELHQFGVATFDLVIIDEAGHATIPETLIPLGQAKRAILIGDDRQLPPIVTADIPCRRSTRTPPAEECVQPSSDTACWLERSLFGRLWSDDTLDLPRVLLDVQFRMHPDIGDFISSAFYEGRLSNGVKSDMREFAFAEFRKPICLVPTTSYGRTRHELSVGTSFQNPLEAKIVHRIVDHLVRHMTVADEPDLRISLGVVSPYSAQTALLQQNLEMYFDAHPRVLFGSTDIASVDRFQGSERDVIIASFVRSPKPCKQCHGTGTKEARACVACRGYGLAGPSLRFVQDLTRMNVAFSRARRMLILVGDIDSLCKGRGDDAGRDVLRRFRDYVLDRGRVLHVWEKTTCET